MAEQSEHWDDRKDLPPKQQGFHAGFPFDEAWPSRPWGSFGKPQFKVKTAQGDLVEAWIDDSTQYRAEGLRWVVPDGRGTRRIPKSQIACWRRL